jgi:hypothetical protein
METTFGAIIDFLEGYNLTKTAKVLRKELKVVADIVLDKDKEKNLLSIFRLTKI